MSAAAIKAALPITATASRKKLFEAVADNPSLSRSKLVDMVLQARGQHRADPVHVTSAEKLVDSFLVLPPEPVVPTKPVAATKPANISRPNWLGEWSGEVEGYVKGIVSPDTTTLLVLYNIPGRDNGNYSAGGLHSLEEYNDWTSAIARGIGSNPAICILEPDALGLGKALDTQKMDERISMLQSAITALKANPNTKVYVDASIWGGVADMSIYLRRLKGLDGFSVNVSGYEDMTICTDFAEGVCMETGLKYVIDTSRNGLGNPYPGKWCNVTDTKVGLAPQLNPTASCDAYLWVKVPGESDGLGINDDGSRPRTDVPSAGTMWPEYRDAIHSGDWTTFKDKYGV